MPISRIGTDGIEAGAVAPSDLSTGAPSWDGSGNLTVPADAVITGKLGVGGANYGTSGQVLVSNGASTPPSWQTISVSPTTAQVLTATAGASVGAVGTYAFLRDTSNTNRAAGATLAGSSLRYSSHQARGSFTAHAQASSGTPSGTWQLMGANSAVYGEGDALMASVWLRIS